MQLTKKGQIRCELSARVASRAKVDRRGACRRTAGLERPRRGQTAAHSSGSGAGGKAPRTFVWYLGQPTANSKKKEPQTKHPDRVGAGAGHRGRARRSQRREKRGHDAELKKNPTHRSQREEGTEFTDKT